MRVLMLSVAGLWVGFVASAAGQADVMHKCTDADGRKHYQDTPCDADQRAGLFDPLSGNVTTIDSETSRREVQGALVTREQTREQQVRITTPADADTRVILSVPDNAPRYDGVYDDLGGYPVYPVYRDNDRRRRDDRRERDDRRDRRRPDETPMMDPPRGSGGNYVPRPPTIRDVAPRPPASGSTARSPGVRIDAPDDER